MAEPRVISRKRIWIARGIAALADVIQIAIFPAFSQGGASPFDAALDVIVGTVLILLVGWHIAFVPTFIIEMLPIADLRRPGPWQFSSQREAKVVAAHRGPIEATREMIPSDKMKNPDEAPGFSIINAAKRSRTSTSFGH